MSSIYSEEEYKKDFSGSKGRKALKYALDIRKFEIILYWKRATYFWAFIGSTFAGYGAVQVSTLENKTDLSIMITCLGIVFSFGWFCVNKGSKQWQENWENHVDMLEDEEIGPLYKVTLTRRKPDSLIKCIKRIITGPSPYSVSKINQIISIYITLLWFFLLCKTLPKFNRCALINWEYIFIIGLTLSTCICFVILGQTYRDDFESSAIRRKAKLK